MLKAKRRFSVAFLAALHWLKSFSYYVTFRELEYVADSLLNPFIFTQEVFLH